MKMSAAAEQRRRDQAEISEHHTPLTELQVIMPA